MVAFILSFVMIRVTDRMDSWEMVLKFSRYETELKYAQLISVFTWV